MGVIIEPELKAKLIDEQQVFIVNSLERVPAIDKILDEDEVNYSKTKTIKMYKPCNRKIAGFLL